MNMFGKTFNTVGSTDSNFVIKTKGDVKILWQGKFINLIEKGKIASSGLNILKTVSNESEINSDGIYLISENNGICVLIGGTKVNLGSEGNNYVSFLEELPEITPDLKYIALTNIGFYYKTLADALNIKAGLIYVEETNKLYFVKDGILTEYNLPSSNLNELVISDLRIYKEDDKVNLASPNLHFYTNDELIMSLTDGILINKNLIIPENIYIQSENADSNLGFRLYEINRQSYLEVDNIILRNMSKDTGRILEGATILSKHDNIILNTVDGECFLKYLHEYKAGDIVYVSITKSSYTVTARLYRNTVEVSITPTYSEDVEVELELKAVDNTITTLLVTIPTGKSEVIVNVDANKILKSYKVTKGPDSYNSGLKPYPVEYTISKVTNNSIFINTTENISNARISLAPGVVIEKDNIHVVLDNKSHTKIGEIKDEPVIPETKPNVGIYSDNFIGVTPILYDGIFKKINNYPKYEGIELPTDDLSDTKYDNNIPNILWIKKLIDNIIPSGTIVMWNGTDIPKGWAVCNGENGTPNLVGRFIKADSTAGNTGGLTEIALAEANMPQHTHTVASSSVTISTGGKHTHLLSTNSLSTSSSGTHSHTVAYSLGNLGSNAASINTITGDKTTSTSSTGAHTHSIDISSLKLGENGEHTHTASLSSLELNNTGGGLPLAWEPSFYSLIFIMKL